jgi:hypothetical protein
MPGRWPNYVEGNDMETKENARLSEESSEKAIDSFPRRYVFGTLASSTTPCALHGDTTNLCVHIIDK